MLFDQSMKMDGNVVKVAQTAYSFGLLSPVRELCVHTVWNEREAQNKRSGVCTFFVVKESGNT